MVQDAATDTREVNSAGKPSNCHGRDADFRIVVSVLNPKFSTAVRLQGSGARVKRLWTYVLVLGFAADMV